jgi:hypothetical protein
MTGPVFGASNTWHNFEIHYTRNFVKFYHDGTLEATHTTNIPSTSDMMPVMSCEYAGTARAFPVLDYFSMAYKVSR